MKRYLLHLRILFFSFMLIGALSIPSYGQVVRSANTEVELITDNLEIGSDPFIVGLKMTMDPHWHTYWKNPGDSGYATRIQWTLPEGISAQPIDWPTPEIIRIDEFVTYGYEDQVILLTEFNVDRPLNPGEIVEIKAKAHWLACKIECVPGEADLAISLPVVSGDPKKDLDKSSRIAQAQQSIPRIDKSLKTSVLEVEGKFQLRLDAPTINDIHQYFSYFIPYDDDIIDHAASQDWQFNNGQWTLVLKKSTLYQEGKHQGLRGVIVAENYPQASHIINAPFKSGVSVNPSSLNGVKSIWVAIVLSFIGGLILNLMPCVLPVLAIKVLNLIEQSGQKKSKALAHGVQYTLGIISTFWILALFIGVLKFAGKQVGWGFQFQSPAFLIFMSSLFFLMALNLFGLFEIGSSLTRLGRSSKSPFANGVLTTIVATPCTAPFMGSALGYALVQPIYYALVVFTFLGIGLAFPFLVLALNPNWLKVIPKPGPWMRTMKLFFGVLFLATVIWLTWVLGIQKGPYLVLGVFVIFAIALLALWHKKLSFKIKNEFFLPTALIVVFFACGISMGSSGLIQSKAQSNTFTNDDRKIAWQEYSQKRFEKALLTDKILFIDFTASWCLSCQVNEKITFNNQDVINRFRELDIIPIKADWTNYDEEITEFLATYGKSSIPLYVLYPKNPNRKPILLPEIITPAILNKYFNEHL